MAQQGLTAHLPATSKPTARRWGGGSGAGWLLLAPLLFLASFLAVPVVLLAMTAVTGTGGIGSVSGDGLFVPAITRTVLMAGVVTAATTVLGTLYAIGVAAAPRWAAGLLLGALFLTLWTSVLVRSFGWVLLELPTGALYQLLHAVGLRDEPLNIYQTTLAPYPAMVQVMLPFAVLPVHVAIGRLDGLQIRAARLFGASTPVVLRKVVLPQLRSSIVSGGVLVFLMSLGFYVTPVLLGSPSNLTVAGLIDLEFSSANEPGTAAAMSLVLLAAVLILYLVADRLLNVSERWG
ncbi:ABC transporter permease [Streptomyces sp. NPDC059373]